MKQKRSLSGIYFRYQNPESGKWENWCFEDLSEEKQDEYLASKNHEWTQSLAKQLANTLNKIGDQLDLTTETE